MYVERIQVPRAGDENGNPPSQRSRILPPGPPLLCRQPLQTGQRSEPGRRPQRPQRRQPCLRPLPRNRRGYEEGSGEYVGIVLDNLPNLCKNVRFGKKYCIFVSKLVYYDSRS